MTLDRNRFCFTFANRTTLPQFGFPIALLLTHIYLKKKNCHINTSNENFIYTMPIGLNNELGAINYIYLLYSTVLCTRYPLTEL